MKRILFAFGLLAISIFLLLQAGRGASYNLHHPPPSVGPTSCWNERNDQQPDGVEKICGPVSKRDPAVTIP